jgi:MraZ protein
MSSFKGRYSYSVDEKGRIAIPAKLRKNIAPSSKGKFVVTRGLERCLYLYPQDEWGKLEQFVRSLSFLDAKHRFFSRTLFQWAEDMEPDGQSRIMIPQELLTYAGIEREAIILGVLDRIEIWSPVILEEYQKSQADTYESVAGQVFKPQP